jgi:hypothetical protein
MALEGVEMGDVVETELEGVALTDEESSNDTDYAGLC